MTYFSGSVVDVIWESPDNSFYILRMALDSKDGPKASDNKISDNTLKSDGLDHDLDAIEHLVMTTTVKGTISGIEIGIGTWFGFEARWVNDQKYGKQLQIQRAPVIEGGWTPEVVASMLGGTMVGPFLALQLLSYFGDRLPKVLDDPESLQECPGITGIQALYVQERWQALVATYKALDFLQDLKLPKHVIRRIWTKFGDDADKILSDNPWELVKVNGISFDQADKVARKLGLPEDSPYRAKAAVLYSVKGAGADGHLFLTTSDLRGRLASFLHVPPPLIASSLKTSSDEGSLVVDRKTRKGTTAIYEPWQFQMEQMSAALLSQRLETAAITGDALNFYVSRLANMGKNSQQSYLKDPKNLEEIAKSAIDDWQDNDNLILGGDQVNGVFNALTAPVSIITGLPGTGKTTSVKGLVRILQEVGIDFLLLSPTGIAAKRLSTVSGAGAHTIHRAFGAKGISEKDREAGYVGVIGQADKDRSDDSKQQWDYGPGHYYPAEVVIVDESSMIDQHLMYRILSCTAPECRVVLIGDAAQLPSVGPGNVLRDLCSSEKISKVALTKIYRQEEASDIVKGAHLIHKGEIPAFVFGGSKDFRFYELRKEADIQAMLINLVEKLYQKRRRFQCLSPKHADSLGVTTLNQVIRERLNPSAESRAETRIGSWYMREGDRIMVSKNNYDKMIFNGDTGKIQKIIHRDKVVLVKLHGPPDMQIELKFSEVAKYLRLAYCVTIHKMQGLESDVIVMPLVKGFWRQLQRNLLYTAVTRAKKKVIMLGHREALVRAVENDTEDRRNTMFVDRIEGFVKNPSSLDALVSFQSGDNIDPEVEFEDL